MKVILASNSPRRKQLLDQIKIEYDVIISDVDEDIVDKNSVEEYVQKVSYMKAKNVLNKIDDGIVIGADTVVSYNNKILGKPINADDAFQMLKKLQGSVCEVYTGLSVISSKDSKEYVTYDKCKVYIQEMTDNEILEYIKTNEPMDKAGAFAIQGIGAKYISKIEGDFYCVVGLPLNKLYNIMKNLIKYGGV